MLPQLERQFLQADLAQVQALLALSSPEDDPIEHYQYMQRLEHLQTELAAMPDVIASAPAGAALLFGGRPVYGSQGIKAAFSSQAIEHFQKMVSQRFAAHEQGALASRGRVPFSGETQLLVTDVVRGSFGFVLQAPSAESSQHDAGALKTVVDEVAATLSGVCSPDDLQFDLAATGLDDRQIGTLQMFFKLMDNEGASLRLVEGERDLELDQAAISRARERVEGMAIDEQQRLIEGQIVGWLDYSGQFELLPYEGGEVIRGAVGREALDRVTNEGINPYKLHVRAQLKERRLTMRNRSPKQVFTLIGLEPKEAPSDWQPSPVQQTL